MLTENDVVDSVVKYLAVSGYRVERHLTTTQQGIDITAVEITTGKRLLVEAKGGTSSKQASKRFGRPFSLNQAKTHVAVALYCAAKLLQEFSAEGVNVALALPDDKNHRSLIEKISDPLQRLEIVVFLVNENRKVSRYSENTKAMP
jgi:hypothetical protein